MNRTNRSAAANQPDYSMGEGRNDVETSAPAIRKPLLVAAAVALLAVAAVLVLTRASGPVAAAASSHSEAPLIGQDSRADNTDLYVFLSPENTDTVTIIAN